MSCYQQVTEIATIVQLLGFPIQLIGLLFLPYAVVKYALDDDDYISDIRGASVSTLCVAELASIPCKGWAQVSLAQPAGALQDRVVKRLPGFDK